MTPFGGTRDQGLSVLNFDIFFLDGQNTISALRQGRISDTGIMHSIIMFLKYSRNAQKVASANAKCCRLYPRVLKMWATYIHDNFDSRGPIFITFNC